jgi:pimeloyl-ACP methyl ester carboxylesterase
MEPEERDFLLADWDDREAAIAMLNWYRATPLAVPSMDEPFGLPDNFEAPEVPNLTIPTLVMWGMDDLALPPANLEGMDEIIDDLTLVKIPNAAHFVTWGAHAEVNGAMDAFLAKTA